MISPYHKRFLSIRISVCLCCFNDTFYHYHRYCVVNDDARFLLQSSNMPRSKDVKSIVLNVLKACQKESKKAKPLVSLSNPLKRASFLLGLSERSIQRYLDSDICDNSKSTADSLTSSKCASKQVKRKKKLDSFDLCTIKNTALQILQDNKTLTLKSLKQAVSGKLDISISKWTLMRALHSLGFRYGKFDKKRACLYERKDIVKKRIEFLRKIRNYRKNNRPIVYLDETWVDSNTHPGLQWQAPEGLPQRKLPLNKGKRFVILHCGGEMGFLDNCKLVFDSKSSDSDYHSEINGLIFRNWVQKQLMPALPPRSVIVMDNASYHSVQVC